MPELFNGTVKWFNTTKGFGFISGPDGTDIFVHYTDIQSDGFKNLAEGQSVTYTVNQTAKGPRAAQVSVIE